MRSKWIPTLFLLLAVALLATAGCGKRDEASGGNAEAGQSAASSPAVPPTATPSKPSSPTPEPSASEESPYHADDNPVVTIEMDNGHTIKIELYPQVAPNTVNNFISLANKGFYDGTIFHRVIPRFMIQGGDPEGTGMGGPDYMIKGEFAANGFRNELKHTRGVISMARLQMPLDSAGSQFFIMVADYPSLDGQYAAFGQVVEGMDTVDEIVDQKIDPNDPDGTRPENPLAMKSVTVDTKNIAYEEPEVIRPTP